LYFILLNQDGKKRWVLVNIVMNLRRHEIGEFLDHMKEDYDFKDSTP